MFSKALFKQSWKANGLMWTIVTVMVCFMLACVMTISGSGSVNNIASGVTDTIITQQIEASADKRALSYYGYAKGGEKDFDTNFCTYFKQEEQPAATYYQQTATWMSSVEKNAFNVPNLKDHVSELPAPSDQTSTSASLHTLFQEWINKEPSLADYDITSSEGQQAYGAAATTWSNSMPSTTLLGTLAAKSAYVGAISVSESYCLLLAQQIDPLATKQSSSYQEIYGSLMVIIDPNGVTDSYYTNNNQEVPDAYDVTSLVTHCLAGDESDYLKSSERIDYIQNRAAVGSAVFLGDLFQQASVKEAMIEALNQFGISEEKYDSYGYDFTSINHLARSAVASYQSRYDYEMSLIETKKANNVYASDAKYLQAIQDMDTSLTKDLGSSFISSLPTDVSDALVEVGKMDVYSLIVGSVYFKMAGLLLPIIYVIMAANNLISSQVDNGSMAYVLSTGTKRSTVVFTQTVFLVASIFLMSFASMITSFICFSNIKIVKTSMSYSSLALMNLGSFAVLFCLAGLNFCTSCIFSRERRSMSIGGGISIFFLVATMLGLFGSKEIPSVVRFSSLNYFNYVSVISLFDVPSIVNGDLTYLWKMAILFGLGLIGFIGGSTVFKKKDLPL